MPLLIDRLTQMSLFHYLILSATGRQTVMQDWLKEESSKLHLYRLPLYWRPLYNYISFNDLGRASFIIHPASKASLLISTNFLPQLWMKQSRSAAETHTHAADKTVSAHVTINSAFYAMLCRSSSSSSCMMLTAGLKLTSSVDPEWDRAVILRQMGSFEAVLVLEAAVRGLLCRRGTCVNFGNTSVNK